MWRLLYGFTPTTLNEEVTNDKFIPSMTKIMEDCEKKNLPYILLSRAEGNSWEEQASFNDGDSLYWESMLSQQ